MDRFEHSAILTTLIDKMRDVGSWCGETHIQKGTYFLQELFEVPVEFNFILYKHGPFSFRPSRYAECQMRSDHFIDIDIQPYPYGPRIISTDLARIFRRQYDWSIHAYRPRIDLVAERISDSKVADLERYATALYVTQHGITSDEERARDINRLKPHVPVPDAMEAVRFVDDLSARAQKLLA